MEQASDELRGCLASVPQWDLLLSCGVLWAVCGVARAHWSRVTDSLPWQRSAHMAGHVLGMSTTAMGGPALPAHDALVQVCPGPGRWPPQGARAGASARSPWRSPCSLCFVMATGATLVCALQAALSCHGRSRQGSRCIRGLHVCFCMKSFWSWHSGIPQSVAAAGQEDLIYFSQDNLKGKWGRVVLLLCVPYHLLFVGGISGSMGKPTSLSSGVVALC